MLTSYAALFKKTWKTLLKNPILIFPPFLTLFFLRLITDIIDYGVLFVNNALANGSHFTLLYAAIFSTIMLSLMIIILTYITGMQVGVNKDVIQKGRVDIAKMISYGKHYWVPFIKISIYLAAIFLAPLAIIIAIYKFTINISFALGMMAGTILLLAYVVFAGLTIIELLFLPAVLASRGGSGRHIITTAFRYSFKHQEHTWATSMISLLTIIVGGGIGLLIKWIFGSHETIIGIINSSIGLIISAYIWLFIFNSFFDRNGLNKKKWN